MKLGNVKYALMVFLGGVVYGISGPLAKFAYADGWTWQEASFAQPFFAAILFALISGVVLAPRHKLRKVNRRSRLGMIALGVNNSATTLLYMYALSKLPVAVALTMLFQFAWLGIVLQLILERRGPNRFEVAAGALVLGGTFLATGVLDAEMSSLDPLGLLTGFGAAISYTLYIHFSAKAGFGVPWAQRGFFVCLGSCIITFLFCPTFFASEVVHATWWKDALPIALSAQLIPVALLGIGTPFLTTGISTIMASSELPSGIFFSAVALSEIPDVTQVIGAVIVLVGIGVSQIPAIRKR